MLHLVFEYMYYFHKKYLKHLMFHHNKKNFKSNLLNFFYSIDFYSNEISIYFFDSIDFFSFFALSHHMNH